jgi:DNA invertase Pin-like site-specific DNA recombinase
MKNSTPNKIGYARVSTIGQNLDSQIDGLTNAGCLRIFTDKTSGVAENRPEWTKLMDFLRPGDLLVVTELSRMTRSLMNLLQLVKEFETKGINLVSLRENIDTSTAAGRAFLSIIGAINQMERELKAERTAAGREAAKARGKTGGRPKTDPAKLEQARILYENSDNSASKVCMTFGISRRTFFNHMAMLRETKHCEGNNNHPHVNKK